MKILFENYKFKLYADFVSIGDYVLLFRKCVKFDSHLVFFYSL